MICDFGGRLAGTESERRAMEYVAQRGALASSVPCKAIPVDYGGWRSSKAELRLSDGTAVACHPLVRSMPTPAEGLTAEVMDLGRGTPEEFEAHRREIAGRIVLVRHELMFVAGTIHRRRKYKMALEAGAVGFLIAGPLAGALVAGSSGRNEGDAGIPAAGVAPETAARLARRAEGWPAPGHCRGIQREPRHCCSTCPAVPMTGWWLPSAHVDGHNVNESAMDNASGVATALAVTRAVASHVRSWQRGVRLAFFSAEEWALTGSARYVAGLSEDERKRIALNVNLDTVAGGQRLTALTSGFSGMEILPAASGANKRTTTSLRTPAANEFRPRQLCARRRSHLSVGGGIRRAWRECAVCPSRPPIAGTRSTRPNSSAPRNSQQAALGRSLQCSGVETYAVAASIEVQRLAWCRIVVVRQPTSRRRSGRLYR